MELPDICLRLTDDAIIPRCRILTGLSPVDEAKARQTLGERFERIRICEYVSGERFLVMPEALFRDFLVPRFESIRVQHKTPVLTGLDAYLGLLGQDSRRRCFAILLRLLEYEDNACLVIILRAVWPEMRDIFTNPSLRGNVWLEGSSIDPNPPHVSLLPARFAARFTETGTPPALRDWLRAREDGVNTETDTRATVVFNDYDFPGVSTETVRQVRGDRAFLETFCHFSLPDADETTLDWILHNTAGLDVEAQLIRRFFPEGAANAVRFALVRWEKLDDEAERTVYLSMLRRVVQEGSYAARALARATTSSGADMATGFRDAWLLPSRADMVAPDAERLAAERAVAIREWGVLKTEVVAAQENMIAAATDIDDTKLAHWMGLGLACEQNEWLRRYMSGHASASERSDWLTAYLAPVGTGCASADRYLHEYRRLKAMNRIDSADCEKAAAASFPLTELEHRASALGIYKGDAKTFVLVVDGMGVEWIPFLVARANAHRVQIREAKCVFGNLPTSTEFNRVIPSIVPAEPDAKPEFPDDSRSEKLGELDDVYHSDEKDSVAGFGEEMRVVEEVVLARVRKHLHTWERVVVTSDHGASRLAVLAYEKGLAGDGISPDKEPELAGVTTDDWRHAGKSEDKNIDDPRFEVSGDGRHLCIKGYRRFSRQGGAGFERHGGATLEERLVPFVVFGRKYEGDFIQPESLSEATADAGQFETDTAFDDLP